MKKITSFVILLCLMVSIISMASMVKAADTKGLGYAQWGHEWEKEESLRYSEYYGENLELNYFKSNSQVINTGYNQALSKLQKNEKAIVTDFAELKKVDKFIAKDFTNFSKEETEFKDPNEAIDVYINYIEGILTDQLSAGLLTYDKKCHPALVVMYTETKTGDYGEENYLHLEILTYTDEGLQRKYTQRYDNSGAFANVEHEWDIVSDINTGIDYIQISGGRVGGGSIEEFITRYKFTGNSLVDALSISGFQKNADIDPNSKMKYDYTIDGKETTKAKYDNATKTKKLKYELVKRNFSSIMDYCNNGSPVYSALEPSLYLNHNTRIKANPIIVQGRTLIPLRALLEEMGATVEWDNNTRVVTAKKDNTIIAMKIDSKDAIVNGKVVKLDVPATLINSKTYIPARFVGESFGYEVEWNGKTKIIEINKY